MGLRLQRVFGCLVIQVLFKFKIAPEKVYVSDLCDLVRSKGPYPSLNRPYEVLIMGIKAPYPPSPFPPP